MDIKKPILVTAIYDIGRDNWESYNLSYNNYLAWMRNTLSLDSYIVIYTERKFLSKIEEMRKEFDPTLDKTVIITTPIEELDAYKLYYTKLCDLMFSKEFKDKIHTKVPEMTKPLYNVIMFNKIFFLKKAKEFFNGDFYIWVDAGGLRENISNYNNQRWPCLNKINELDNSKITFFSHSQTIMIRNQDIENHALSQQRYIQGTAFLIPVNLIDELLDNFNQTINESLEHQYIGSDEKIFDITYCKNKTKYSLIKCDWRTYFNIFKDDGLKLFDKDGNRPSKIFLDLGSHQLQGLKKYIDKLYIDNSWEIHCFEPNSMVKTEEFIEAIKELSIQFHKKAVWIRNGRTIFNQHGEKGEGQGSLLEETEGGKAYGDFYAEEVVDCVDLLDFIKKLDPKKDIYIKMDIEWSEYKVLNKLLSDWPKNIKKIWIEWHGSNSNKENIKTLEDAIKNLGTDLEVI